MSDMLQYNNDSIQINETAFDDDDDTIANFTIERMGIHQPFYSFNFGKTEQIVKNDWEGCEGDCSNFFSFLDFKWKQSSSETLLDSRVCEASDLPDVQ